MRTRVFIDGDQGTTGIGLKTRLQGRDDLHLVLLPDHERRSPRHRAEAINDCDIAVLCLPDAAARDAVASVRNPRVRVIDASAAHRVSDGWVYGLPEMAAAQPERIARAGRVSNPGCYATGAILLLRPLIDGGRVDRAARLSARRVRRLRACEGRAPRRSGSARHPARRWP